MNGERRMDLAFYLSSSFDCAPDLYTPVSGFSTKECTIIFDDYDGIQNKINIKTLIYIN